MDFDDIQDEKLKGKITAAFSESMTAVQVPEVFGQVIFDYLTTAQTGEFYRSVLPDNCQVMLEYFGRLFVQIEKHDGYRADKRQFHQDVLAELSSVFNDIRLSPLARVQVVFSFGNMTYLIALLIDFANYPYWSKRNELTNSTTTIS